MKNNINKTKIIFKTGSRKYLDKIVKKKSILIVCTNNGKKRILQDKKFKFLKNLDITWISDVMPNPNIKYFNSINNKLKKKKIELIIAVGGGSVIDTAKTLKILLIYHEKKLKDLFNLNELNRKTNIRLIILPTTSGTGSEVTCFATIWDTKNKKKLSLNYELLLPDIAIVDPELTYKLPIDETINTGLDALNQAFEASIWNKKNNKKIAKYGEKSIKLILNSLPKLVSKKSNYTQRKNMSLASLYSGLCISYNRTSLCHSISYPLTSNFNMPHGLACAITMIPVIKYIHKKDKNFFNVLLKKLKLKTFQQFESHIEDFFMTINLRSRGKKYIKNQKE